MSVSLEIVANLASYFTNHWSWTKLEDPLTGRPFAYSWEKLSRIQNLGGDERHQRCLSLRADYPREFAQVAEWMLSRREFQPASRLRVCLYCPALWRAASGELQVALRGRATWAEGLARAGADFLASLPGDLLVQVAGLAADHLWLQGEWTPELQTALQRCGGAHEVRLQLALLSDDETGVTLLMQTEFKRMGYQAVHDFLQGRREVAYSAFQKLIARRRPETPVFPPFVAIFARLCALSQGDLHLFRDSRLGVTEIGIELFLRSLQEKQPPSPPQSLQTRGLAGVLLWSVQSRLACRPVLPSETSTYLEQQQFTLMADQLSSTPRRPWLPQVQAEAPWETMLRLLDHRAEVAPAATATSASKSGALFWNLVPPLVCFTCDRKANPEEAPPDLPGRLLSSKTLLSRQPDYLTEKDRVALAKVRLDAYAEAQISVDLLRTLVGHPRVYFEAQRATLQERVQQLRVVSSKEGLRLQLHPAFGGRDYILEKEGERVLFWTRSPAEKQLSPLLENGTVIPKEGVERLKETLRRWVPRIEVNPGKALPDLQQAHYLADQLALRIRPGSRGWRLDWVVRCPQLPGYVRPALEGLTQERFMEGNTAALVERDLEAEESRFQELLGLCPALPEASAFRCQDPGELLEILDQAQRSGVSLEWPEGQAWKVRRATELQLRVQQGVSKGTAQDWFSLQGGLQLQTGESLDLSSLLASIRLGQGPFLQLGPQDYVLLESSLREQVEQLSDLVDAKELKLPGQAIPSLAALELSGLTSDQAFQDRLETLQQAHDYSPAVPRSLQAELRDYQVEGFQWLARHARMGTGACLADDMGLGKTLQALALMLHHRSDGAHLVVCPLSVMNQWAREMERFAPSLRPLFYEGKDRDLKGLKAGDVVLCSYAILQRDATDLSKRQWAVAVLDEAQAIKNPDSQTARAAFQLKARVRLATTGTPIENRLSELWSLFAFLNPGLLGTLTTFRRRFESTDGKPRARLRALVSPFILRRLKSQVLSELPPRTELSLTVPLSPPERQLYEHLRSQAQATMEQGEALELLAHLTRLRQACCHPRLLASQDSSLTSSKLEALLVLLDELRQGRHRALVFSQFTRFLDLVEEQLQAQDWEFLRLDGSTSVEERRRRVDAFQEGQGDVFLISLKAGGSGLNLTGADYVVHLDPWWNPAVEDQASDRAHRIGQHRPVTVYRLIAENTIEEKVVQLHGHKRDLAQSVLEGQQQAASLPLEELKELLRQA